MKSSFRSRLLRMPGFRLELSSFRFDGLANSFVPRRLLVTLFVAKALTLGIGAKAIVSAAVGLARHRSRGEQRAFLGRVYEQVRLWEHW